MDGFSVRVDTSVLTALKKAVEIPESVQKMFANELLKLSDPYTPFASGVLKDSGRVTEDGKAIEYNTPYANYLYHGKLMVDPKTRKGAFYSPDYGFWSRPGVPKELTDRDLQFQGAPQRGAFWVQRTFQANTDALDGVLVHALERELGG